MATTSTPNFAHSAHCTKRQKLAQKQKCLHRRARDANGRKRGSLKGLECVWNARGKGALRRAITERVRCMSTLSGEADKEGFAENVRPEVQKALAWLALAGLAVALRDFVGVAFATFVVSYIGNSVTEYGERFFPGKRRVLVLAYFALIVLLITSFGLLTIPAVTREGAELVVRIQSENPYVLLANKLQALLGERLAAQLEKVVSLATATAGGASEQQSAEVLKGLAMQPDSETAHQMGMVFKRALKGHATLAVSLISKLLSMVTRVTLHACVSLIFSFLIVWDLPKLKRGLEVVEGSRIGPLYREVAPSVGTFGALVGKALQAQVGIALVNTGLTAAGMWMLELPSLLFLSLIVFFCSFIPVAGVVVSTIPMSFVALSEFGLGRLVAVIAMVAIIHAVEAYLLNPAIYSAHLKLHPLLVLIVLLLAEHTVGVWGLVLAVPFSVFVVEHLIKRSSQRNDSV